MIFVSSRYMNTICKRNVLNSHYYNSLSMNYTKNNPIRLYTTLLYHPVVKMVSFRFHLLLCSCSSTPVPYMCRKEPTRKLLHGGKNQRRVSFKTSSRIFILVFCVLFSMNFVYRMMFGRHV